MISGYTSTPATIVIAVYEGQVRLYLVWMSLFEEFNLCLQISLKSLWSQEKI